MEIEIQKKFPSEIKEQIKVKTTEDVFNLKEIQEIKNAMQEHLLFIGLDRGNNIKCIRLIGIGSASGITVDSKEIVRTALLTAVEKVILVHNHPSNSLEPSKADKHFTNFTNKVLEVFNIELLDHIIVNENDFVSIKHFVGINKSFETESLKMMNRTFLLEENIKLKKELEHFKTINSEFEEENER